MDAVTLFAPDEPTLWRWQAQIDGFVRGTLRHALNPGTTRLVRVADGVPFLGFRVFPRARPPRPPATPALASADARGGPRP